jgi:hypothetical protein
MKNIGKLLILLLALSLAFTGCSGGAVRGNAFTVYTNPTEYQGVVFENGGMQSEVGINNRPRMDLVRTKDFLKIDDFEKIEIGSGYQMIFILYSDRDYTKRVTSSGWLGGGRAYAFEDARKYDDITVYPSGYEPVYFRIVVANANDSDITTLPEGALTITKADGKAVTPEMTEGTIDKGAVHPAVTTRIHTKDLFALEDYESVHLNENYKAVYHIYNADGLWLGSLGGWQLGKAEPLFTAEQMADTRSLTNYISGEKPVYFKFQIKSATEGAEVPVGNLKEMGLKLTLSEKADKKNLNFAPNEKKSDFTFTNVFEIGAANNGPWQEGAISGGNLFVLNHAGQGAVFSLDKKEQIGSFTLDKRAALNPHANSVVFSSTYYEEGDKYPLMYVNVYNNYAHQRERFRGYCMVYRILEDKSGFSTKLVQVINIGFTEDLNMWKSLENNGDVCGYGNFVVDTDNNKLYAFVMRDANKTTRFFEFDLPQIADGEKNLRYGCNLVTLEADDIKNQFDTEYFEYIQGCDYLNGMILSAEGLGYGAAGNVTLRLVDLKTQRVIKAYDPTTAGLYNEPEVIAVDPDTKKVYFSGSDGQLRQLNFLK